MDQISILNHNFDITGFTETWFNSVEDSNLIDLENYAKIDSIRPNRTGGRACMFIDSKHNFIQRTDLNIKATDCDSVFIEIPDKNIIVGLVYKPDLTRQLKANNMKSFKNSPSLVIWDYINSDKNPETSYSNFLNKTTEGYRPPKKMSPCPTLQIGGVFYMRWWL